LYTHKQTVVYLWIEYLAYWRPQLLVVQWLDHSAAASNNHHHFWWSSETKT